MRAALQSSRLQLLLLLLGCAHAQVVWVSEPPARLVFSNSSGARVTCAARATPPPLVTWLGDDGAPLASVPGLREVFSNGTLVLGAFAAGEFRADVHAAVYRCRAANARGAVLSRDMRPVPVMDVQWEARVVAAGGAGGAGGVALLTCALPAAVRAHAAVTRWFRDAAPLPLRPPDDGGMHVVGGSRGEQLVVRGGRGEGAYSCEVLHELTAERKRSEPLTLTVAPSSGSMAPRMLTASSEEWVRAGADIRLLCAAAASPPPTYSWFRQWGGRASAVAPDLRLSVSPHLLVLLRARAADAGRWSCRAHNQFGEQRRDVTLHVRVPLSVTLAPQLQVADSGSSVMFNCSVSGGAARVRWLHDGVPVGGGERELRLRSVARAHRGMYQCLAERDMDLAQASAELRLGDTAPELHYTFIEQALHPGPALALHCAASGTPAPRFTWLLDSVPIEELSTPHRSISQFVNVAGEVVSYLNVSSVRAEDGGRYTCRAANSRGAAEHSARLNVYGPPSLRSVGPVRAVAGLNTTVYCPYSGFPISDIRWQRGSVEVTAGGGGEGGGEGGGGHAVAARGGHAVAARGGQLLLWPAEPADAGLYSCRVTAPSGQYAQKDIQIFVRNPPKISGFSFPTDLVEGSSVQVLCGITSGDKPVYFSWLKDGLHIPNDLQVQEKSLEDFSFLIFSRVSARHSGRYTCVAANNAAAVNHTATLFVKVAPSWVYEPQNVSVLLGAPIIVHCTTKGYPAPRITWVKEHGLGTEEFRPVSNMEFQTTLLVNGSLSILSAARHHEGLYMCRAENGIGRGLTKTIYISVNEPAAVEAAERNVSAARGAAAALGCTARGDAPLALRWTRGDADLQPDHYRVSISEKRSEGSVRSVLRITRAERHDTGVYRCRAENPYGRDELLIYLAVQELPTAPRGVAAARVRARGAVLRWRRADDGGAAVRVYRLQLRAVTAPPLPADWSAAPARDLPAHTLQNKNEPGGSEDEELLEYTLDGLRPATVYALRLAAINAIGDSEYSETIIIQTLEEAPSEPPHNVQVQATAPGELFVQWQTPPQESWNGELLGYAITWREVGEVIVGYEHSVHLNVSAILTVLGWGAARATVVGLKTHAHYELKIRAFNTVGGGPPSTPITVTTIDGPPEAPPQNVRCEALSSQAIRVRWEPPPLSARGGILLGYEISYEMVGVEGGGAEWWRRAGGGAAELGGLRAATAYRVQVRASTAAGAGPAAPPAACTTHDDLPGPPADVKAVANSEDSIIVSWLAPLNTNGKITHYTVYYRPQSTGVQSSVRVPAAALREQWAELRGLRAHVTYEAWVAASGARGQGGAGPRVSAAPALRAPARVVSFPRLMWSAVGSRLRVPCVGAGSPTPRAEWSRGGAPLQRSAILYTEGPYLVIQSVDSSTADNYTCVVRNAWGEQRGVWVVRARRPPPAPRAAPAAPRPAPTAPNAPAAVLALHWDPPALAPSDDAILGYIVEYQYIGEVSWHSMRLSSEARSLTLPRLACGTTYKLAVRAYNSNGVSTADELVASTTGGVPKPPLENNMISTNKTCVRLNLLTWDSSECPITQFIISIRSIYSYSWRSQPAAVDQLYEECHLNTATWHQLKVHATNSAGTTTGNYHFATLSETGESIPAPASFPDDESTGLLGPAVIAVILALLAFIVILAVVLHRKCPMASCKGYEQDDAMSDTDDKSSVEKRNNRRNCQQVYTSSPIKPHLKKDHQELYEISPYATFSMATGATGAGVGAGAGAVVGAGTGSGTLRTFGRAEPLPLNAVPPRRSDTEEYCVSRGMALSARRAASDSDSSNDEPCRAHRTEAESVRGVTDSSAESASGDRRERRRRRRNLAAHNTPRYQQRQEQERRDYTIHV